MSKQTKNISPWLWIGLGLFVLVCLCIASLGLGYAFFVPNNSTTETTIEEPATVVVEEAPATLVPAAETGNANPHFAEAAITGIYVNVDESAALAVLGATRPADEIVSAGDSFNTTAPAGEEYLMINVDVICGRPLDEQCSFTPNLLKVVLSDGSTRDLQTFIQGVDGIWDTTIEIAGGAEEQGKLFFILPVSETDIVLRYQDIYTEQPFYFQIP